MEVIVQTDGGARGNPGPAAIAAVVRYGETKKVVTEFIGHATNNQAEYRAVILGLNWVAEHCPAHVALELRLDSELVGRQLSGLYRIKDLRLKVLYVEAKALLDSFSKTTVTLVRREENKEADRLVNEVLDGRGIALNA